MMSIALEYGPDKDKLIEPLSIIARGMGLKFSDNEVNAIASAIAPMSKELGEVNTMNGIAALRASLELYSLQGVTPQVHEAVQNLLREKLSE